MRLKYFLQLLTVLLGIFFSTSAHCSFSQVEEARVWAKNKGEQILKILADKDLERKYTQLDKILFEDIDLDHAARFVAGRYWKKMDEQQRLVYVPLFKRYTAALYKSFPLDIPKDSLGYEIGKVQTNKDFIDVFCTINIKADNQNKNSADQQNVKMNVIFTLEKENDKIMVRDLKIGESSLLITYRERIYKMIHQDNDDEIEWFLEDFENITADKEEENLQKLDNQ